MGEKTKKEIKDDILSVKLGDHKGGKNRSMENISKGFKTDKEIVYMKYGDNKNIYREKIS